LFSFEGINLKKYKKTLTRYKTYVIIYLVAEKTRRIKEKFRNARINTVQSGIIIRKLRNPRFLSTPLTSNQRFG